jgi:hypothetical protein
MTKLKSVIPAVILIGGLWISVRPSYGKAEYAKTEKKGCTFCHVSAGKPDLNDAGKYYKDHDHSLDGYKPAK